MAINSTINLSIKQKLYALIVFGALLCCLLIIFAANSPQSLNNGIKHNISMCLILVMLVFALYVYCIKLAKVVAAELKYVVLIAVILAVSLQINIFFSGDIVFYARPLLLPAMLLTMLIGRQTGLFVNTVFMVILYFYDVYALNFVYDNPSAVYTLLSLAVCGTLAFTEILGKTRRIDTILTAFRIGILSMLCGVAVFLMFGGSEGILFFVAVCSYLSAYFSLLIYLGMLPLFEKIFNIVTSYRLNELTEHNRPLLNLLSEKAPGTFNHCLAVSNMAEACALAIGEDPQLARTAAYYHDIGKIKNPLYFKENQADVDPHEDLTPELSANFIRKHTIDGYNICKQYRLPEQVAKICLEHHGTTVIKYFYYQASKFSEGELGTEHFRYGGPKPTSKIAAILMIADASEAAIRTLTDRSKENVQQQVQEIIDERMNLEQFSDCDITMRDLYTIIDVIVMITAGYYHDRVEYPQFKFSKRDGRAKAETPETPKSEDESDNSI